MQQLAAICKKSKLGDLAHGGRDFPPMKLSYVASNKASPLSRRLGFA